MILKNELNALRAALVFYTRLPVRLTNDYQSEDLTRGSKYLPLVGIITGTVCALVYFVSDWLFHHQVAVVLSLIAGVIFTGAFHEDGFSDSCDGLGGGYQKAQILAIMKDSCLGTYGGLGMMLLLLLRYVTITNLDGALVPFAFVSAHAMSRFSSILLIRSGKYARTDNSSKSRSISQSVGNASLAVASFFMMLPFLLFTVWIGLASFLVVSVWSLCFYKYVKKRLDGYTGDILGAAQQVAEVLIYLTILGFQNQSSFVLLWWN